MSIKGIAFAYSFDRLFKPSNVLFCRCGKATQFFQILRKSPTFHPLLRTSIFRVFLNKLNYQTKGIISHRKIVFESKTVALFCFEKRKYGKKSRLNITLATDYWLLQKEKKTIYQIHN